MYTTYEYLVFQQGGKVQLNSQFILCKAISIPLSSLLVSSSTGSSDRLVGDVWVHVFSPGLSFITMCVPQPQTGMSGM